jgi:GNAT superfamily N-acetyltransferase
MRPASATDAGAIADLVRTAFAAQPVAVDPPPSALRVTEADIIRHLQTDGGAVAELSGEIAGVVLWERQETGLYISRLAVAPRYRRRGVATALLAAAEDAARYAGVTRLRLGTRLVLTGNRRLFAGCGFTEITQHAHPGFAQPTWVEMDKRLD